MTFTPGVNVLCATLVPIIDDDVLEDNQTFIVVLNSSDPNAFVNPAFAIVTIVDNDGKIATALSKCTILDFKYVFFLCLPIHLRCHCGSAAVILHCE